MTKLILRVAITATGLVCIPTPSVAQSSLVESIRFVAPASRLDWCPATGRIAFDRLATDGYYDLLVGLTAADELCLTCGTAPFSGHAGNPSWHPSCSYMVFQAQDVSLPPPVSDPGLSWLHTSPGWGINNNLWIVRRDGAAAWQLTTVSAGSGTLHPHFSRAGSQLLWAERLGPGGEWTMKLASLVWASGRPQLANIRAIAPLGSGPVYETHGFAAGDTRIIFSAGDPSIRSMDIYLYDLLTSQLTNLTNTPGIWDEHAHVSWDGNFIIWASSRDISKPRDYFVPFLDYWMMNMDGSNPVRLTYFNDPAAPEHLADGAVTADLAFAPDDGSILGRLEIVVPEGNLPRDTAEMAVLIRLRDVFGRGSR